VAVSPKISTTEANLKLFSYLGMALPTVVFDNPVNREILGDLGIYATAGDVKSLAGALVSILQDRSRARQLGVQGRVKAAADYSWLAVGKRLKDIYESVGHSAIESKHQEGEENNYAKIEDPGDRGSRLHGLPFNK
jgi:glycosyltransferase involved in cell wall biosynthesis